VKAAKMGYGDVLVYAEGMPVWEEAGHPMITGPDYEAKIETTKMLPQELNALAKSGDDGFLIVDVRDESEYAEGHIPGAINIPVASFASRSGVLDKKKTIIVYCNAGGRSYKAYRKLMKLGYKKYYQSLFGDWKESGYQVDKS
jgi:rhodanese-related sulfurtransferase